MPSSVREIADALVAHCKADTTYEALDTLYAEDAVSVEAMPNPETGSAVTESVKGIHGKHEWWDNSMDVKEMHIGGPFMHGDDRFAVTFRGDVIEKASGNPFPLDEVAVYTVKDGKIVLEEFFYTM